MAFRASRCFRSDSRRVIFAFAARTASVRVGCFFGCGAFNAFPAAGIIGNACVGMTEPRLTGCVVMGPVGADLFLAIPDNALPPGSFDGLAVAHPKNPKCKVPSPALWSAGFTSPGKRSAVVTDVANVSLCSEQGTFPTVTGCWAFLH